MHSTELVGVEHPCVLQGTGVREVQTVDEHEHDMAAKYRGHEGVADVLLQLAALLVVLLVQPDQGGDEDDEQHDDDPDALAELHDDKDQNDAERQHRGETVYGELVLPALLAHADVMLGHASARHGEAGEDADRVDADQDAHLGVGPDEERLGADGEDDDPVREDQPVAAPRESAREEGVFGHEAGKVREPVEARVGAGVEDQHRRAVEEVEAELSEPGGAEYVLRFLGEHRRAAVQVGNGMGDVGEQRHTENEEAEDGRHEDENPTGIAPFGRAEGRDTVRDRLEAGQR